MLDDIWGAVSSIPDKIKELATIVGNFFSDFWKNFTEGLSSFVNSIGKFFENVGKWLSDLGSSIANLFSDLWNNLSNAFKNVINGIGNIFNWLGNFFQSLWDFVYHIFIPTDEQWSEIKNDYYEMGDVVKSHIPFVGLFSEELKKAQATVEKTDPLVIRIPSFSYSGSGGIGVDTGVKEINLTQFYEPYRAYIRGFIFFFVVALAFVYIVKYVLNYGVTSAGQNIDTGDKGGNE